MNKTSHALIETILSTDDQLSQDERLTLANFLGTQVSEACPKRCTDTHPERGGPLARVWEEIREEIKQSVRMNA